MTANDDKIKRNKPEFDITPDTKIAALLDHYPALEDELLKIAPAFAKLKNPILRKTVAKIATLKQAAQIGNVPLPEMINRLRRTAGLSETENIQDGDQAKPQARPDWVNSKAAVKSYDIREMIEKGEHPISLVLKDLGLLNQGQLYELTAPFLPAPLIDKAKNMGFSVWSNTENEKQIITYFCRR